MSTLPLFSMVKRRFSNASGRGVPMFDSSSNSTSRTSITSIGMSISHVCDGSVCEIAVNVTMRCAPAAVETCGGTNCILTSICPFFGIKPVEPEVAPGSLLKSENPALQPEGACRNKSYPISVFPSLYTRIVRLVGSTGWTGTIE